MEEQRLSILIGRFTAAATAHGEALEAMDAGRADRHATMLARLYREIAAFGAAGRAGLLDAAERGTGAAAGMAAVYSLSHDAPRSLAILRRLAREPGLLGFRASVAIERWEKGELTLS
ncbi:hypothetical protein KIP69_12450 [Geobacter sulfurreducens]|jgi:hypothetical protein|uniref:DUF2019 domain-containing protein n=1 Tax=Geobacter sulfurreducens (strain ATCC 51573 / DSM 12127 / PCA) TaxID=243231 RepID=Q74A18_GEOSL|nr:hypothetical protein [Geobacter sulfurreducens]AAR35946.1 hypothetical protein GSU2573 [Geobacter sulfurreducens PCA]ADI85332.1 hypothetical protein KN400_2520 [Geobacter sulfurreducens KN400]AJY68861.1 hypothetical protein RW64_04205 [Geobacter sulfurreducens]QVW34398.1 hypothetical protein KIP69_12450 [Geobacter sulfurreducens]UAC03269.1 hypothetical protein KVP06_12915 [Geobacter sulfurreducens]